MNKFKLGGKVRYLGGESSAYSTKITIGDIYTVSYLSECYLRTKELGDDTFQMFFIKNFKLVEEETIPIDNVEEYIEDVCKDTKTGSDKRRFTLLPVQALKATLDVFESGNIDLPWRKAYPVDSWRQHNGDIKGSMLKYIESTMRHLMDIEEALETGDNSKLFTEDTGVFTAGAITFGGLALTQFCIELTGKTPSADGKREIKAMKEGSDPYAVH